MIQLFEIFVTPFQTNEKFSQVIDYFAELLTSCTVYETRSDFNTTSYSEIDKWCRETNFNILEFIIPVFLIIIVIQKTTYIQYNYKYNQMNQSIEYMLSFGFILIIAIIIESKNAMNFNYNIEFFRIYSVLWNNKCWFLWILNKTLFWYFADKYFFLKIYHN